VRATPYRHLDRGAGCVGRAAGDWTLLRVDQPGRLRANVSFSLGRAARAVARSYPAC
jgi:hypothetical protein